MKCFISYKALHYNLIYMSKNFIFLILILIHYQLSSQERLIFDRVFDTILKAPSRGYLYKVVADSAGIFAMGQIGRLKDSVVVGHSPLLLKLNYSNKVDLTKIINDSTLSSRPYFNEKMFRKNDSIYLGYFYLNNPINNSFAGFEIFEVNIRNGIFGKRNHFYDFNKYTYAGITTDTELFQDSIFHFILRDYTKSDGSAILFKMDINFNILDSFQIKYNQKYINNCYISARKNYYEIILERFIYSNNKFTGKGFLEYHIVDSMGNVLLIKKLNVAKNLMFVVGDAYTIVRDNEDNFIIACLDTNLDNGILKVSPYIFKVSPEFDSIIWIKNLAEFQEPVENPRIFLKSLIKIQDSKDYLLLGEWETPLHAEPDYGLLYKISKDGNLLWSRNFQPLGWDSTRGSMLMYQLSETPFKTFAIAAGISDRESGYWHPWLLHVDSSGCLVPGCDKLVKTSDLNIVRKNTVEIYPNPVQDKLYILSRMNSYGSVRMNLHNLKGDIILQNKILLKEGVQYIVDIPTSLNSGIYVLSMIDDKGKVLFEEKVEVIK